MGTGKSGRAVKRLSVTRPRVEQKNNETDFDKNWGSPILSHNGIRIIIFVIFTTIVACFFYPEGANCVYSEVSKILNHSFHGAALNYIANIFKAVFVSEHDDANDVEADLEKHNGLSDSDRYEDNEFVEFEHNEDKTNGDEPVNVKEPKQEHDNLKKKPDTKADEPLLVQPKVDQKTEYQKMAITNEKDYLIRNDLDSADNLFLKDAPEQALVAYRSLLTNHPGSPRAQYGVCRCLDKMANLQRSNKLLEESIKEFERLVFATPFVPDKLFLKAGMKLAELQSFRGWSERALKTCDYLLTKFPRDVEILKKAGVNQLVRGNNEKAKQYFEKVLKIDPNNHFSLVHIGYIFRATEKDFEASVRYYEKGMKGDDPEIHHGRFYHSYGEALYRLNRTREAYEVFRRGAEKGAYPSQWQRSIYNCDKITSQPWWTKKQTGAEKFFTHLEENWKTIRDEALRVIDEDGGRFLLEDEGLTHYGKWTQFTLFSRGAKNKNNCRQVPLTCAMIDKFKSDASCTRGQIKFSLMNPKVHIWPHCGPTNCRIRAHLGLVIPKEDPPMIRVGAPTEEPRYWKEGKFIIFDDSFDHEAWHDGKTFRLVLIVDIWHPEVTSHQRDTLSPI